VRSLEASSKSAVAVVVLLALVLFFSAGACAAANAYLSGNVIDVGSGKPFEGTLVEAYLASDHTRPVASVETDERGYYNMSLPSGNYDVYARIGKRNPSQSIYLQPGQVQIIDFKISMETISEEQMTSSPLFWVQVVIAGLILVVILVDQIFFKQKRILRDLAAERSRLENEIKKDESGGVDELSRLRKEKNQLEYMINLTRTKYHKKNINEESFREIIRDYQEKLIEVEAKIASLEGEKVGGQE